MKLIDSPLIFWYLKSSSCCYTLHAVIIIFVQSEYQIPLLKDAWQGYVEKCDSSWIFQYLVTWRRVPARSFAMIMIDVYY